MPERSPDRGAPPFGEVAACLPDAVLVLAADGRTLEYVSPAIARVAGLEPVELRELWPEAWIERHVHPDDRWAVAALLVSIKAKPAKAPRDLEFRLCQEPGGDPCNAAAWRWIGARLWPCRGEGTGALCLWRDVTAEKSALAALLEAETRYESLFDALPEAVVVFDRATGRILDANRAALARYEYSRDQIREIGMSALEVSPGRVDGRLQTHVLPTGIGRPGQKHRTRTGRELVVEVHLGETRYEGRPAILAVIVDMSAREQSDGKFRELHESLVQKNRELEQALERLRRAQELLVQTRKMEAVGQLASGVAHNFNNLLTVVIGTLDILSIELPPDSPLQRDLSAAQEASLKAADVARKLLSFSHQRPPNTGSVDVGELVRGAVDTLQRDLPPAIRVRVRVAERLPPVDGDASRLETALVNLALNARDAMPHGGELSVEAERVELGDAYVAAHPEAVAGPHVRIVVGDTGVGMDAETLARLFEPFFTTKPPGSGAGLGLATVYATVRAHGGHITVRSEPERGSAFTMHFPIAVARAVESPKLADLPLGDGETLLVVDDDPAVLRTTERALAALGYDVLTAESGASALALIDKSTRKIALVLIDIVMPNMGGLATLRRLRQMRPELPAVLMTGFAGRGFVPPVDLGVEILPKPLELSRLAVVIREAVAGKQG
jgi:PAS domain S-box-containing protein